MKFFLFMKSNGYKYLTLRLQTIGDYSSRDSEWNYSDIPHLNYVHTKVDGHCFYADNERIINLFMQKFGPFSVPVTNYIEHVQKDEHFYVLNILGLLVSVTTSHKEKTPLKALTTTEYKIFYRNWVEKIFAYLIRYATKKNYKVLMSEDVPMRNQRGFLRKKGIKFLNDNQSKIGFFETEDLSKRNVDGRSYFKNKKNFEINLRHQSDNFQINDLFLTFVKSSKKIFILGDICQHEGAKLSFKKDHNEKNCRAACPWHGMIISPLLIVNMNDNNIHKFKYLNQEFSLKMNDQIMNINIE